MMYYVGIMCCMASCTVYSKAWKPPPKKKTGVIKQARIDPSCVPSKTLLRGIAGQSRGQGQSWG